MAEKNRPPTFRDVMALLLILTIIAILIIALTVDPNRLELVTELVRLLWVISSWLLLG